MVRAQHSPIRIEPHLGKISKDTLKPSPSSEHWGVLHIDESGSYFANDTGHFLPESRLLAFDSCTFPGCADVLAGESSRHHVNTSAPSSSVKGSHVIPDRERLETPVVLTRHEYASGILVVFDGADGSPPEQSASENASTSARE
jgi:hypothetical protein